MRHHDCVIMPGFGAIIASSQVAHYDISEQRFYPPMRMLCFNSVIKNDDGLLVNSLRRRGEVSYEEARTLMQRQIHTIKVTLERDGEVTLGKVGTLRRDEEGNISFHPFHTAEQIMTEMGLTPVNISLKGEKPANHTISKNSKVFDNKVAHSADEYILEEEDKLDQDLEEVESEEIPSKRSNYYKFYINKTVANVAAIIMVVVLVLSLAFLIPHREVKESHVEASVVPVATLMNSVTEKQADQPAPSAEEVKGESKVDAYYLIVGTFRHEAEAEKFIELHKESVWGLQTIENKERIMVVAASAADQASLLSLSADTDFSDEYSQSWIWHRR